MELLGVCLVRSLLTGQHPARITLTIAHSTKKLRSTTYWRTQCRAGHAPSAESFGRRYMVATTCLAACVEQASAGDVVESITAHTIVEE